MPDGHFGPVEVALSTGARGEVRARKALGTHHPGDPEDQESHLQLLVELLEHLPGVVFVSLFLRVIWASVIPTVLIFLGSLLCSLSLPDIKHKHHSNDVGFTWLF